MNVERQHVFDTVKKLLREKPSGWHLKVLEHMKVLSRFESLGTDRLTEDERQNIVDAMKKLKREKAPGWQLDVRQFMNVLRRIDDEDAKLERHGTERLGRKEQHKGDVPTHDSMHDESWP